MNYIVLGANFGDEGKGSVVSNLIKQDDFNLVIRFNGGHQVGHTVIHNGIRHVFSNFGSGTLQGVPTYWSKYCTIHPLGILNEYDVLKEKEITPVLYIDPLCPVVTPFDIADNQTTERQNNHGSVGVGFGSTIKRQEAYYKLYAQDLLCESVARLKLEEIAKYYGQEYNHSESKINKFLKEVEEMLSLVGIKIKKPDLPSYYNYIFEGGQGILLDQDFGFFPHVTRSNTTSKNAMEIIKENNISAVDDKVIYVTRAYTTRHGYGPLPCEHIPVDYINKNPEETNVYNLWQREFRYAPLNLDLLKYAIMSDRNFHNYSRILWMTCVDQVGEKIPCIKDNKVIQLNISSISKEFGLGVRTQTKA
jgi:adenylosuccinate synthase